MHHFFVPPQALSDNTVILTDSYAHQLHTVLRMRAGEEIILLNNQGRAYRVRLENLSAKRVAGQIIEDFPAAGEPPIHITLYQCLLKRDNFEWVLQKGTELGIREFVPILSERTIPEASPTKVQRWERILTEAAEQSRRGQIPLLQPTRSFSEALTAMQTADLAILAWEDEDSLTLKQVLEPAQHVQQIAVCIGAEGGFSPAEVALARQHGIHVVSLGARILRAETAAIFAASVLAHHFWG